MADTESPRMIEGELGTYALQIQQFLDEWMFRILNAGMAGQWDRQEAILKALEIFEAMGMTQAPMAFKLRIVALEDDEEMCLEIAKLMPGTLLRNLESFFLQLQLAISTVGRVRCAIEEGTEKDLKEVMEDGDAGISQTILKNTVLSACSEVKEVVESEDGWKKAMKVREARLVRAAEESEKAQKELDSINRELAQFGGQQNSKTASIIMSMNSGNTRMLMQASWMAWAAHYAKFKTEKHIHMKWRGMIADAEEMLMKYKMEKKGGMKSIMAKQFGDSQNALLKEVIKEWSKAVAEEKEMKGINAQIAEAEAKLAAMKASQKENAKKAMASVAGQSEAGLKAMMFKEWTKFLEEEKKDKAIKEEAKAMEARLKDMQAKGKDGQKGVLAKMSASTDTGLLKEVVAAWVEEVRQEKKARAVQEQIDGANSKFAMLKDRNKAANGNRAQSANELDDLNIVMHVFMHWHTQAKIANLIHHYGGKMDKKKEQLEKVQTMFKSFATQLEAGIGNSPRSQRSRTRGSEAAKPPAIPS